MGPPRALDRIAQGLLFFVALVALANGAAMLAAPFGWYQWVETVRFTGPPNAHFIRDIGIAYAASGALIAYAASWPEGRWPAALAGGLWLGVHGALHVWEVATGVCAPGIFWRDAPGVLGPPVLVALALMLLFAGQRVAPGALPRRLFVGLFERLTQGRSPFIHDLARAPGRATEKFQAFMPLSMHRRAAPPVLFHMARLGAVLAEDCGPCAQLAAEGALADGVPRDAINAALIGQPLDDAMRAAFAFGEAITRQTPDANALGDAIEAEHGRDVRLEMALAAATVRVFPALKRGLGYAQSCALTRPSV